MRQIVRLHAAPLFAALVLAATPLAASAADRTVSVTSFARVRVEGPFVVVISSDASPSARVTGERDAIEQVDLRQDGDTVTVRAGAGGWGERSRAAPARPVTVALATLRLDAVAIGAGADVKVGPMKGARIDLSVTGAGTLAVERVEADRLVATVVGAGTLSVAGKAASARLMVNGPGGIAAPALVAGDLFARVEGAGELTAGARFTAQVTSTALGSVTVLGKPKCQVRAPAGGAVRCGG